MVRARRHWPSEGPIKTIRRRWSIDAHHGSCDPRNKLFLGNPSHYIYLEIPEWFHSPNTSVQCNNDGTIVARECTHIQTCSSPHTAHPRNINSSILVPFSNPIDSRGNVISGFSESIVRSVTRLSRSYHIDTKSVPSSPIIPANASSVIINHTDLWTPPRCACPPLSSWANKNLWVCTSIIDTSKANIYVGGSLPRNYGKCGMQSKKDGWPCDGNQSWVSCELKGKENRNATSVGWTPYHTDVIHIHIYPRRSEQTNHWSLWVNVQWLRTPLPPNYW